MNIDPQLLTRHRDGDPKATEELTILLLPLIAENLNRQRRKLQRHIDAEELESVMHVDLCIAVDRLKRNEKGAEEVEKYIMDELKHSWRRCMRQVSEDLLPRKGKKKGEAIRRTRFREHGEKDGVEQMADLTDFEDRPSIRYELEDREEIEALAAVAETERECQVTEAFLSGFDPFKMEELEGINATQVKAILKRLRERATKQASKLAKCEPRPRQVSPQFLQMLVTGDMIGDKEIACVKGSLVNCHLSPHEIKEISLQTNTLLLITTSHSSLAEGPLPASDKVTPT